MVTGKTASGFDFAVNENIGNDFRFLMAVREAEKGDVTRQIVASVDAIEIALGKDGLEALRAHCATEDGFEPMDRIMKEFQEIMSIVGEKNKEIKN